MEDVLGVLGEIGIIPVIKINELEGAKRLASTFLEVGLNCVEITFRTPIAPQAIQIMSSGSDKLLVGAGTVLDLEQAKAAIDNGAKFIVTPGFSPTIIDWCLDRKLPVIPGVATPTEIIMASERNLKVLKFFPAEALGGIAYLKVIASAAPNTRFIPTGGINELNLSEYTSLSFVHACGGSWLAKSNDLEQGEFREIGLRAANALSIVQEARGRGKL